MEIDLFDIFCLGVDYGLLKAEEERESEEWADAFNGFIFARKYSMPSQPLERRKLHSEKWFEAKRKSWYKFLDIQAKYLQEKNKKQITNRTNEL